MTRNWRNCSPAELKRGSCTASAAAAASADWVTGAGNPLLRGTF